MARSFTRSQIHTRARFHADLEGSNVGVTDVRVNELLNAHLARVYRDLVMCGSPDHYSADFSIPTVPGVVQYALPSDFWKAVRILRVLDANRSVPIGEIGGHERGYYQPPQGVYTMTLEYIPTAPNIDTSSSGDGVAFDGIAGYEEVIAKLVARDLLAKESSEHQQIAAECTELLADIRTTAKRTKTAQSITDESYEEDDFWYWSGVNMVRAWRLRAGNVELYERRVRP